MSTAWNGSATGANGAEDIARKGDAALAGMVMRRRDLAARLAALSREQSARIAAGDHDATIEILFEREGLVGDIAALSAELHRRREALGHLLDGAGIERERLRDALDDAQSHLDEVAERDEFDLRALRAERASRGVEVSGNARAQAAVGAYNGRRGARMQDGEA